MLLHGCTLVRIRLGCGRYVHHSIRHGVGVPDHLSPAKHAIRYFPSMLDHASTSRSSRGGAFAGNQSVKGLPPSCSGPRE